MVGQPSVYDDGRRPHLLPSIRTSQLSSNQTQQLRPQSRGARTVRKTTVSIVEQRKIDDLGEFIELDSTYLSDCGSWSDLFHHVKGRSNFSATLERLPHKAKPLLLRYANQGVPVLLSTRPWTLAEKDAAIRRGNHPSTKAYAEFIHSEMTDMRKKGMFIVLPYDSVRNLPSLRLSPLGCVPQRERRPRIINDYTFSGVNPGSLKLAPPEAMQWGRTLNRVLWYILNADSRHGPVLLSKTDLSDGFYQLHLTPTGALKLAVPFSSDSQRPLVAVPTRLPMGWTESPPAFSAVTETIADMVNSALESSDTIPRAHPLETTASTPVPLEAPLASDSFPIQDIGPLRPPLAYVDVYVDDFIKLAQGWANALKVRRHTYHEIDSVLRPNDEFDVDRKSPISLKKLQKGDDFWSNEKVVLGWLLNTLTKTITLPPHRKERLHLLLDTMLKRKRASRQEWQRLLGELRSMQLALPGSAGCFSLLQEALGPTNQRIKITPAVRDQLKDFKWIASSLSSRPTHLAEVVPTPPSYYGAMDAAKEGMGGVWFPPLNRGPPLSIQQPRAARLHRPILWRARFPPKIQAQLVSQDNPAGSITNSDLELAGAIAQDDVLSSALPDVAHLSTCTFSDNTPAVSWKTKGSTSTQGPAAYLLQTAALHKRHHRYQNELHYLPGRLNTMADDCSRLWQLSDSQLVSYFNSTYPQATTWKLHHLRPAMLSVLTSNLQTQRLPPESYLHAQQRHARPGQFGLRSATPLMSTRSYRRWPTLSKSSKFLASAGETDESRPVASPTELARWRTPFAWSARNFPAWGPRTLV